MLISHVIYHVSQSKLCCLVNYAKCDIKRMMFDDKAGKSLPLEQRRKFEKLLLKNLILIAKNNLLVDHFYRWWILQMIVVVLDAL